MTSEVSGASRLTSFSNSGSASRCIGTATVQRLPSDHHLRNDRRCPSQDASVLNNSYHAASRVARVAEPLMNRVDGRILHSLSEKERAKLVNNLKTIVHSFDLSLSK